MTFRILPISIITRRAVLGFAGAALLAGCSPEINHRGYYPKAGALAQVSEGMAKSEVEGILGSPSTTASINFQGDSYYYISSTTQGRSFLEPVETNREVIAVRFDKQDQVTSVAQYGLEDGRVINLNSRKTPSPGSEFNILNELLRRNNNVIAPERNLKSGL
jgi:outer membrane protein assembly factor BamE (lipoprotein component of BamABCDE complex)